MSPQGDFGGVGGDGEEDAECDDYRERFDIAIKADDKQGGETQQRGWECEHVLFFKFKTYAGG